jgi:hypothetical protein
MHTHTHTYTHMCVHTHLLRPAHALQHHRQRTPLLHHRHLGCSGPFSRGPTHTPFSTQFAPAPTAPLCCCCCCDFCAAAPAVPPLTLIPCNHSPHSRSATSLMGGRLGWRHAAAHCLFSATSCVCVCVRLCVCVCMLGCTRGVSVLKLVGLRV